LQDIDTTTPGGKALFQMMGVFAELEPDTVITNRLYGKSSVAAMSGLLPAARGSHWIHQSPRLDFSTILLLA
jgi:hypothetical protein